MVDTNRPDGGNQEIWRDDIQFDLHSYLDNSDNETVKYTKISRKPSIQNMFDDEKLFLPELDYPPLNSKPSTIQRLVEKFSNPRFPNQPSEILLNTKSLELNKKPSFKRLVKKISNWTLRSKSSNWSLRSKKSNVFDDLQVNGQVEDVVPAEPSHKPSLSHMPRTSILKLRYKNMQANEDPKNVRFKLAKKKSFRERVYGQKKIKVEPSKHKLDAQIHENDSKIDELENTSSQYYETIKNHAFVKNSKMTSKNLKYLETSPTDEDLENLYKFLASGYHDWESMERSYARILENSTKAQQKKNKFDENSLPQDYKSSFTKLPDLTFKDDAYNPEVNLLISKADEIRDLHQQTKWKTR